MTIKPTLRRCAMLAAVAILAACAITEDAVADNAAVGR
jgi:hypothetical protein